MELDIIKREIERRGGAKEVAKQLGVSMALVYYWINGQREPSDNALKALGLVRITKLVRAK